jgi:hypothetical protein
VKVSELLQIKFGKNIEMIQKYFLENDEIDFLEIYQKYKYAKNYE